ncbi:MAG: O-antigen ligase C-terminal domain-containing protein [Betaproteobacteria bacterium]|nr:O-antigen ligase C-terminal domain-containing protein [Betaproteobacteria bacterium]
MKEADVRLHLNSVARDPRAWLATAAAAAPSLLAYNLSPSPTFLNQALALGLWAGFVLVCAPPRPGGGGAGLWAALGLVALGVLWSWGPGALPSGLALSALGMLLAAVVMAAAGTAARQQPAATALFVAFSAAWVIAGVLNVLVGVVQVFAPALADGQWIASSNLPGRAVGNLRQPNHLSSLLLWSTIALVALVELGALSRRAAAALGALFVFGVVLTASRTGVLSVLVLALWGALDRRLAARTRALLLAAPIVYALAWVGLDQWAKWSRSTFGGAARLADDVASGDLTSARFAIWSHTLQLIRESPWLGVGFGEFNFAWTLTPLTQRPKAFFDHTHNLPLHLAVELGLPLAAAVLALLAWALARAARAAWRAPADDASAIGARAGVLMVLMIGLHSLLEYPLWYAYFLLPAAWVWGFALGTPWAGHAGTAGPGGRTDTAAAPAPRRASRPWPWLNAGAALVVLGAALAIVDYMRVVVIFESGGDVPLAERIERGRRSVFFAHHADYAAVTSGITLRDAGASFASTTHYLLDSRLMIAWAEWLEAQGRPDLARHLAARLREFRSPDAAEFFAACPAGPGAAFGPAPEAAAVPFQCQAPARTPHWREYLAPLPIVR